MAGHYFCFDGWGNRTTQTRTFFSPSARIGLLAQTKISHTLSARAFTVQQLSAQKAGIRPMQKKLSPSFFAILDPFVLGPFIKFPRSSGGTAATEAMARYASPKEKNREKKGRGGVHSQLQEDEEGACLLVLRATGHSVCCCCCCCCTPPALDARKSGGENILVSFSLSLLLSLLLVLASTRTPSLLCTSLNRHLPQGWFSFLKTSTPLSFLIRSFQLIPCLSLAPCFVAVVLDRYHAPTF